MLCYFILYAARLFVVYSRPENVAITVTNYDCSFRKLDNTITILAVACKKSELHFPVQQYAFEYVNFLLHMHELSWL